MKKLIAILVVFAIIPGFIFAQVSIGGSVGFGAQLIEGDSSEKGDDDPAIFTNVNAHWVSLNFGWQNEENTAGAKIKVNGDMNKNALLDEKWDVKLGGMIWWQPLPFIKFQFTNLEDEGVFGRGNAIDWGYNANSSPGNVTSLWGDDGWNSFSNATLRTGNGFFGGLGGGGENVMALSIMPIDMLTFNFAWDLGDGAAGIEDMFKRTLAQLIFDIPGGIGQLGVSFHGLQGNSYAWWSYSNILAIDFSLGILSGIDLQLSGKIPLDGRSAWNVSDYHNAEANSLDHPVEIGLGFAMNQWSSDPFRLMARVGVVLPTEENFTSTVIGFDINPSFDIGIFRVYFDLGIAVVLPKDGDTDFFWHFNPYIRKGLGIGDLYFGINLWNGTARGGYEPYPALQGSDATGIVNFAVPIFFEFSF